MLHVFLQDKTCFVDEVSKEIPTHSRDEIQWHKDWYDKYLVLLDSKRKAIADWKKERKVTISTLLVEFIIFYLPVCRKIECIHYLKNRRNKQV